jgi:hypothetical protein
MRLQQQMTELAIKGDGALATLRPVEESPEWATFDEDATTSGYDAGNGRNGTRSRFETTELDDTADFDDPSNESVDPWTAEESTIQRELDNTALDDTVPGNGVADEPPSTLPGYPEVTMPQLRARMRRLTVDELREVLDYERAHDNRPEFVAMLTRRIGTLRDQR